MLHVNVPLLGRITDIMVRTRCWSVFVRCCGYNRVVLLPRSWEIKSWNRMVVQFHISHLGSSVLKHYNDRCEMWMFLSLKCRHNEHDGVSNRQPHHCLLNLLFRRRSKKTTKLHVTGFFVGNSPGTSEFPTQMASNAETVSIWRRHHVTLLYQLQ